MAFIDERDAETKERYFSLLRAAIRSLILERWSGTLPELLAEAKGAISDWLKRQGYDQEQIDRAMVMFGYAASEEWHRFMVERSMQKAVDE
jgi:hypothetical protein